MESDKTATYRDAVNRGHQLARAGKWAEAMQFYQAALKALPTDVLARTCLAQSLYHNGNLSEAFQEYERLVKASPKDALLLMRMAEIRRKLGAAHEATDLYLRAADVHLEEKRKDKALEIWQMIADSYGENIGCLERLSKSCGNAGEKRLAAEAMLGAAYVHAEVADQRQAVKACRRAIDLDRSYETGQRMLKSLENGTSEWRSLRYLERLKIVDRAKAPSTADIGGQTTATPDSHPQAEMVGSGSGVQHAEEIITEEMQQASKRAVEAMMEEAEQFHQSGDTVAAVAILCGALDQRVAGVAGNGAVASVAEDRIRSLAPPALKLPLAELANLPFEDRRVVLQGMLLLDDYLEQGLAAAAVDTCLQIIERAPEYLPAQARLADIYVVEGNVEAAKEKYSCIVRLYEMRDDSVRASLSRGRLVNLFSEDNGASESLADTLLELGDLDAALDELMKLAERLQALGDAQGCLDQFAKMLQLAPDRVDIGLRLGEVAEALGRTADAKDAWQRVLAIDPDNREAILSFTVLSARIDIWSTSHAVLDCFFRLVSVDGDFASVALDRFATIDSATSDKPEIKLCLGVSLHVLGKADEARRALLAAIAQSEYVDVVARYFLALVMIKKGEFKGVLDHLKLGLTALDGLLRQQGETRTSDWLRLNYLNEMRSICRRLGDEQGRLAVLEKLKQANPDDKEIAQEIIDLYFSANQPDLALKELDQLTGTRSSRDELERALAVYRDLVARFPKNPILRKLLSNGFESLGMVEDAARQLEVAVQLELASRQNMDAARDMRHVIDLYRIAKPEKVLLWRERLAKLTPGDVSSRTELIDAYLRMGFPAKSLSEARALARELIDKASRENAISVLQTVLSLDPWDTWALEQLGVLLESMKRVDESTKTFRRLLAIDPENATARRRLATMEGR